jgi:hypothetical protein
MTGSKERKVMVSQLTDYPTLVQAIQDFFEYTETPRKLK